MDELVRILNENAEAVQALKNAEELASFLREKGIDVTAQQLEGMLKPAGVTALDDDALDNVAGGLSAAGALFSFGGKIFGLVGGGEANVTTLAYKNGPVTAQTMELRGGEQKPASVGL